MQSINPFAGLTGDYHLLYIASKNALFLWRGSSDILAHLPNPFIGDNFIDEIRLRLDRKEYWRAKSLLEKIKSSGFGQNTLDALKDMGFDFRQGNRWGTYPARKPLDLAGELAKIHWPEGPLQVPDPLHQSTPITDGIPREPAGDTSMYPSVDENEELPNPYLPSNQFPPGESCNNPAFPTERPQTFRESYNSYLDNLYQKYAVEHPNTAINILLFKIGFNLSWKYILKLNN